MLKKTSCFQFQNSPLPVLSVIWIIATIVNIDKAFHIDDAFHLEAAQWIQQNPFKPMSGLVNWEDSGQPIYHGNQPPLYFYLIAAVGSVFSYSEVPLHLFQSIFTALCIIYFYKLVRVFNPDFAITATALLVLGPAFLVNQNLMTDIPILSVSIIFVYLLVNPDEEKQTRNIYLAAAILSAGLLIKFSLLPLLVILAFKVIQSRKASLAPAILLPIVTLAAWTAFNYIEYGGSQLLGRQLNDTTFLFLLQNSVSFLLTLGSVVPFTVLFINGLLKRFRGATIFVVNFIVFVIILIVYKSIFGGFNSLNFHNLFWLIFFTNGVSLILSSLLVAKSIINNPMGFIIILWGTGMAGFIILFAPFMATRHILLVIPPIIIISNYLYDQISSKTIVLSILLTCLVGGTLSVSDWIYADFYRIAAPQSLRSIPSKGTIWSVGHWGWQWYSKQAGMKFYDSKKSVLVPGDYLVSPESVSKQSLPRGLTLTKIESIVYPVSTWNKLTTAQLARFYNSYYTRLPWYVTLSPADSVTIYKIVSKEQPVSRQ